MDGSRQPMDLPELQDWQGSLGVEKASSRLADLRGRPPVLLQRGQWHSRAGQGKSDGLGRGWPFLHSTNDEPAESLGRRLDTPGRGQRSTVPPRSRIALLL